MYPCWESTDSVVAERWNPLVDREGHREGGGDGDMEGDGPGDEQVEEAAEDESSLSSSVSSALDSILCWRSSIQDDLAAEFGAQRRMVLGSVRMEESPTYRQDDSLGATVQAEDDEKVIWKAVRSIIPSSQNR